jgi:hypothetical protein
MEPQSQKRQDAQIAAAMAKAGRGAAVPAIQFGRTTLTAGTVDVTGVVIGGGSRVYAVHSRPNASTALGVVQTIPTSPTTFTINAITPGGTAVLAGDLSDVDWLIVG